MVLSTVTKEATWPRLNVGDFPSTHLYFAARYMGAKYCDECVCMSVSLSARISKKLNVQTSWNFLYVLSMAVARCFSDDNRIRYVLPVLWMTSCFPIMGPMASGIDNIYTWTPCWGNFPTYSPGGGTLFDFAVVYNGSKLRTAGVQRYRRAERCHWLLTAACGIKAEGEVCCLRLPCLTPRLVLNLLADILHCAVDQFHAWLGTRAF